MNLSMNIYSYLKCEHREVNDMMERILFIRNSEERRVLFTQIRQQIMLHIESEQETFYIALENSNPIDEIPIRDIIAQARIDLEEIQHYLDKLTLIPVESTRWLEQYNAFKHAVLRHVYDEEHNVFTKAQHILSEEEATQLAVDMEKLKQQKQDKAA